MRATPWVVGCTRAPILWQCDDNQLTENYSNIHEIPTSLLANQTELALVLLMDRSKHEILFQIPNTTLNWRYHFGCKLLQTAAEEEEGENNNDETETWLRQVTSVLQKDHDIQIRSIRQAGTMLFTFPKQCSDPMRVQVFEASVDSSTTTNTGGVWTGFDEIPYTEMWADDVLWLPWFVQVEEEQSMVEFEGHFIFHGKPGSTAKLVAHNCQRIDKERNAAKSSGL